MQSVTERDVQHLQEELKLESQRLQTAQFDLKKKQLRFQQVEMEAGALRAEIAGLKKALQGPSKASVGVQADEEGDETPRSRKGEGSALVDMLHKSFQTKLSLKDEMDQVN